MASDDDRFGSDRLKGLDEMGDFKVAEGEPDPRGWDVYAGNNKIGEVDDLIVDTASMKVRYLDVDLDDDALRGLNRTGEDHASIPVERVQLDRERKQVFLGRGLGLNDVLNNDEYHRGRAASGRASGSAIPPDRAREYDVRGHERDTERTLTRAEEEVDIRKDRVQTGEVVVGKHVETEHFEQPVTRRREEVTIERHPVSGRSGDAAIGAGQDEVRIPITEEQVTVEKHPVVKEELVINKRTVEERDNVGTDVRKERFDVKRGGGDHE